MRFLDYVGDWLHAFLESEKIFVIFQKETIWIFLYLIISLPFLLAFSNLIRKINVGCIQVLALELSKGFIGTYVKGFNRI